MNEVLGYYALSKEFGYTPEEIDEMDMFLRDYYLHVMRLKGEMMKDAGRGR